MPAVSDHPAANAPDPQVSRPRRQRRRLRTFIGLLMMLAALACCVVVGIGWYFSAQLLDVTHTPDTYTIPVLAESRTTIELARIGSTSRPGTYGLVWRGGRALVGGITAVGPHDVVRHVSGNTRGLKVGTDVRLDHWIYSSPAALHLNFRTLHIADPLGSMPAWYIPGSRRTWVISVHGYKANWTEPLRSLPVLHGLGLPVLDLSYRNDLGAPASQDHLYHLGASEWLDVQAGVRYALAHGARRVILYGYSMGGATVEYFLAHSVYSRNVKAVVLDSPVLDWSAVLDLQARERGLPGFVTMVGKQIVAYRIGLPDLQPLAAIHNIAHLHAPTLLIQGTADTMVPVASTAAFARALPHVVTYITVPGAEHTESWNVDPAAYDARLKAFLERALR